jgi:hypothetical protein
VHTAGAEQPTSCTCSQRKWGVTSVTRTGCRRMPQQAVDVQLSLAAAWYGGIITVSPFTPRIGAAPPPAIDMLADAGTVAARHTCCMPSSTTRESGWSTLTLLIKAAAAAAAVCRWCGMTAWRACLCCPLRHAPWACSTGPTRHKWTLKAQQVRPLRMCEVTYNCCQIT